MAKRIYTGRDGLNQDLQAGVGEGIPIKFGEITGIQKALRRYDLNKNQEKGRFSRPPRVEPKKFEIMDKELKKKLEERIKEFREMTGRDARCIYLGSDQWKLFTQCNGSPAFNATVQWNGCEVMRVDLGYHVGVGI